jgi:hypothetical protein
MMTAQSDLCPVGCGLWGVRDGEIDGLAGTPVDLGELVVGVGEADLESFDFAGLALVFGLADRVIRLSRISAMRGRWTGAQRERRRPSKPTTGSRPMLMAGQSAADRGRKRAPLPTLPGGSRGTAAPTSAWRRSWPPPAGRSRDPRPNSTLSVSGRYPAADGGSARYRAWRTCSP